MAASQVVKASSCGLAKFLKRSGFLARFCAWFVAFQLAPKFCDGTVVIWATGLRW
jgi:hypothetical protein